MTAKKYSSVHWLFLNSRSLAILKNERNWPHGSSGMLSREPSPHVLCSLNTNKSVTTIEGATFFTVPKEEEMQLSLRMLCQRHGINILQLSEESKVDALVI